MRNMVTIGLVSIFLATIFPNQAIAHHQVRCTSTSLSTTCSRVNHEVDAGLIIGLTVGIVALAGLIVWGVVAAAKSSETEEGEMDKSSFTDLFSKDGLNLINNRRNRLDIAPRAYFDNKQSEIGFRLKYQF